MTADTQQNTQDQARLERVKRIIRSLASRTEDNGVTEAEAMEAAAKIGALLAQNDLELSQVMLDGMKSEMVKEWVFAPDDSAGSIIVGIGKLCSLIVYRDTGSVGTRYALFGHNVDVELAKYLWEVCSNAMEHDWVQYGSKHGFKRTQRDSFRMGFSGRVHGRLLELKAQRDAEHARHVRMSGCTDLVVVKDQIVKVEWEKEGIQLTKGRARTVHDRAAFREGRAAGERVNLSNPITDGRGVRGALR